MKKYSPLVAIVVGFVCCATLSRSLVAEETVRGASTGLVSEKPAEGPAVKVAEGWMVPYTERIPGSDVEFEMIPIPGGEVLMGSPADEEGRNEDEGPQVRVKVEPMWVAKEEISWAEYSQFMRLYAVFKEFEARGIRPVDNDAKRADAITAPTELYEPTFTYEYGQEDYQPAVTMTQYAARQYTKWLSRVTGSQYRLPTEAEWEYACRAGTKTPYSWGEDAAKIDDYAWYFDNCYDGPQPGAEKKPNDFGLYDMHGSVAELTVDRYTENGYADLPQDRVLTVDEAVQWPETAFPTTVRGGSWEMDPEQLRSAARLATDEEEWKNDDPNYPKSPWWFTSDPSRGVGFRLFRSYKPKAETEIAKYWGMNTEDVRLDVETRLLGGRGVLGLVDPELPAAIEEIED